MDLYSISEFNSVNGEVSMMNEILLRGPISCGVYSDPLNNYTGGIINFAGNGTINHAISLVG